MALLLGVYLTSGIWEVNNLFNSLACPFVCFLEPFLLSSFSSAFDTFPFLKPHFFSNSLSILSSLPESCWRRSVREGWLAEVRVTGQEGRHWAERHPRDTRGSSFLSPLNTRQPPNPTKLPINTLYPSFPPFYPLDTAFGKALIFTDTSLQ